MPLAFLNQAPFLISNPSRNKMFRQPNKEFRA
jgi:hypothetical protein